MTALELAQWQFAITTIYHFLFVPLSIGLTGMVAWMHTKWHRTGNPEYLRMTKFWGKLMLITFAIGVATGILQEFQFGMNWSDYSRFVGDVFGAPLAMEGLIAFFLESTFLGLWIFGWGRLPARIHLATIWAVAVGTMLSAYFILAANSWMQHPVGVTVNPETGRAEMDNIFAVLTNSTVLYAFPHTILGAYATAAFVVLGISAFYLLRRRHTGVFLPSAKMALVVGSIAVFSTMMVGHFQAQLMTEQQPMKMAAAEALYDTEDSAGLSLFAVAAWETTPERLDVNIQVPGMLSFLSTNSFNGEVEGINDIQAQSVAEFGPGNYQPIIGLTYWSFRAMIGAGTVMFLVSLWGLWLWRRGSLVGNKWFTRIALASIALPFIANTSGWVFTEVGRQPWVVQGLLRTDNAVSPSVSTGEVLTSFLVYFLIYALLAVAAGILYVKYAMKEPPPVDEDLSSSEDESLKMTMAY